MIELILVLLGLYVFFVYIVPFCAAIFAIVAAIAGVIAVAVGVFVSVKNYFGAIFDNINFLNWTYEKGDEPARRSYFFGPGYAQLGATISDAFSRNAVSAEDMSVTADDIGDSSDGFLGFFLKIIGFLYKVLGYICIFGVGTALCVALALVHGFITTAVMILTYIVFTVVWLIDRIYLLKNKIRSICPVCKDRFLIPYFVCPDCGRIHKKLVPGPYGIWHHTCECGKKLPSTFLNNRSSLEALCANCHSPLVASDARPVVFQLIGGTRSGKTVYLSAFFHELNKRINSNPTLNAYVVDEFRPYFDELEEWYNGANCAATTQMNSQMYPLMIESAGTKRQFSVFDIAGEMFDGVSADSEIVQQQFHYCDGLLFLVDPFSNGVLRNGKEAASEDISNFSDMPIENVTSNFINYLIRTGHAKANVRCEIPIAVLIAKSDIKEVRRAIGPAKIKSIMRNEPDKYATVQDARDGECRQFLIDIGMGAAVNDLETQFTNLHYFPVSAQGHESDGSAFEPWGIMEAIDWILPVADKELAAQICESTTQLVP